MDGCSPDAWCAQSGVFVWWTRAFYAARGHAPRVGRLCVLPCATLPVLCSSIHVVSHVRLSHLKRSLSRKVQFPPPHVSNWPLSPCTMLYGRLQTRNPLYALAKVRSGVVIILHLHAKRAPRRTAHLVSKPTDVWRQLFTHAGSNSARRLSC